MLKSTLSIGTISVILWLSFACRKPDPHVPPAINFYYWKTKLNFDKNDEALADSLGMKKIYLRFFDVDWSPTFNMPVPIGSLVVSPYDVPSENYSFIYDDRGVHIGKYQAVPVVYLTNRVFEKDYNADSLAAKISTKIQDRMGSISVFPAWGDYLETAEMNWDKRSAEMDSTLTKFKQRNTEIQLDCDWTPSTRERYFAFLEAMKRANPGMDISCTVRLHQFRDREKAGIPPVSRATLMCYNFDSPTGLNATDAIFDPALADGYLKNSEYPLSLEAALPMFSWGALFHEAEFKGLAAGLSESDVKGNPLFKHLEKNRYQFTKDTVFQNSYMREGDLVRLDEASPAELRDLAARLGKIKAVQSISFFEWDPTKINEYHVQDIFDAFSAAR
jgi:hypothetical protein